MSRPLVRLALVAFLFAAFLSTPAHAANKEHQQMVADIRMLQEQQQRLQLQLATVLEALKTVSAKLDESAGTNRKLFADQKLLIDNIAGDLRVVREKADDSNVRLGTLSQDVEAIHQNLVQGMAAAAAGGPPPAGAVEAGAPPPAGGAPTQPGQPARMGELPRQQFQQAFSDYTRNQFDLAITEFEQYLAANPKAPDAPDAQVYIGDSHRLAGRFADAIAAYTKVINNYPNSSKVPEAYYRRGQSYEAAGDKVKALQDYDYVIKNYQPDNNSVILASQAKKRIEGKGAGQDEPRLND
jgi:TolA-binding protein